MNSRPTQCDRIKKYLNDFGSISPKEAYNDLGIMRLASRISEMRRRGIAIGSRMESSKNIYGEVTHYKRDILEEE